MFVFAQPCTNLYYLIIRIFYIIYFYIIYILIKKNYGKFPTHRSELFEYFERRIVLAKKMISHGETDPGSAQCRAQGKKIQARFL